MRDKYTDSIRIGIVSSINPDKGTAQVTFKDRGGIVSRDLHLNFIKTREDYYYCMPDIGERVRCFFDPEAPTKGYIPGSFPSDTREPPIKDKDKTYVLYKDQTLVEYDRALHTLTIKIPEGGAKSIDVFAESDIDVRTNGEVNVIAAKDINVSSAQNINITADINMTINVSGDTIINTGGSTTINSQGAADITSETSVCITAPVINLNG